MSIGTKENLPVIQKENLPECKTTSPSSDQVEIEMVKLFVDCVRFGAEVYKGREGTKADWEKVHQDIALLDKQMEKDVKQMEHEMSKITDKTERLKILINSYAAMDSNKSALIAEAVGKSIVQLTAEG